jgi:tRNA threonylcarbamoyl adenosine modification protein (Sua5/YciO/YrdC/YwlC family)
MLIEINAHHPEPRKVRRAVEALEAGEVIAYPTDTIYALGCDLLNRKAIDRLYQIKRMPKDHPLAFICPDMSDLAKYAVIDTHAYRLLRRVLPGPYTFILRSTREVPKLMHLSDKRTVGIRVPASPPIVEVVRALGRPVVSTTAQTRGPDGEAQPIVDARDLLPVFKGVDLVLDGGLGGLEPTTVVDLSEGVIDILREGAGPINVLE